MATKIPMKNTLPVKNKAEPAAVLDTPTAMAMMNAYADTLLGNAYANFRSKPSGDNTWKDMCMAMMVYQQAKIGMTSDNMKADMVAALTNAPIGAWGKIIVQVATGMTLNEALQGS